MAGAQDVQPRPRPERPVEAAAEAVAAAVETAAVTPAPAAAQPVLPARDPSKGAVTNLPIPRYVSLKTNEGNARRGPSLTHRIDWVFTHAGMPLRITAEYEHWRRIEDLDGAGGWIHYSLLSGVRTVMVVEDMVELRAKADRESEAVAQAERGVIGKVIECNVDWCRIAAGGEKGWLRKTSLWGVDAEEIIE
ncbi:SH3 domain-containing protein [Neogemmobacter tilapiae]